MIVGNSAPKYDAFEIHLLTQLFSKIVHPSAKTHTSEFWLYKYINPIKHIAFFAVSVKGVITCYLSVCVRKFYLLLIYNYRKRAPGNLSVNFYNDLPLGENLQQLADMMLFPVRCRHMLI